MSDERVALGVDVGGTFTDVVLLAGGDLTTAKVPTTPSDQSRGVARGVDRACEAAGVDPETVDSFRHASTVATNALLERSGATTALVTTAGFGDVLAIGRQDRPDLYDHTASRPPPLVPADRRLTVAERATPDGVEDRVEASQLADLVERIRARTGSSDADSESVIEGAEAVGTEQDGPRDPDQPVEAVAVCFLHAYAAPENEQRVAGRLREALDVPVSVSHEVLGTFREYERTATTVADATVTPVVDTYLGRLLEVTSERGLPAPRVMQSNGGIASTERAREAAVTTALSGPAAGVVGASLFEPEGAPGVISLDMGGTSCDVGLVRDGEVTETTDGDVGDHPVRVPMVDVETLGAGGGSIARVDAGGALRVGPASAGADPGPACYDRGGTQPTVTDAALVLGYLDPGAALGGDIDLAPARARDTLDALANEADLGGDGTLSDATAAAAGVFRVANAAMTGAIRAVTVERGHDPRSFALVAYGGAGPMHAAVVADRLGVGTVLVPRANGVLSALGLLAAAERHDAARTHRTPLSGADADRVEAQYAALADRVGARVELEAEPRLSRVAACRYEGQSYELPVPAPRPFDPDAVRERFHAVHERERGFRLPDEPVDLVTVRVRATAATPEVELSHEGTGEPRRGTRRAMFDGEHHETPVYRRSGLAVDARVDGPAIVEGGESTVVVPPAWTAAVDARGTLVLEGGS